MSWIKSFMDYIGVQKIDDFVAENELLERKLEAMTFNYHHALRRLESHWQDTADYRLKYIAACERVLELEQECNQWAAQLYLAQNRLNAPTPYPEGATKYSRRK